MRKLGVMIVADHPIMRDGLRRLLRQQPDMELLGESHDVVGVLPEFERCQPDVLLIDLQLPRGAARDAIVAVRNVLPSAPIVVLTTYPWESADFHPVDPATLVALSKTAPGDQVIAALRQSAPVAGVPPPIP